MICDILFGLVVFGGLGVLGYVIYLVATAQNDF